MKEFGEKGIKVQATALGSKATGLLTRIGADLVSQEVQLGDSPNLERLIGAIKVQIDDFDNGKIDAVYLATNRFINTMKQDPTFIRLLPRSEEHTSELQSLMRISYSVFRLK